MSDPTLVDRLKLEAHYTSFDPSEMLDRKLGAHLLAEAAARIAELEAERDGYHATNENLIGDLNTVRAERDRLRFALQSLYSAIHNQVMEQARAALSPTPSGDK